ncbi:hypothetical protein [Roseibium sp.]|uniref:hypothetical protein n=1 Tax=Roseibium sp. TaxID=1936156 RepID=UPI00391A794D
MTMNARAAFDYVAGFVSRSKSERVLPEPEAAFGKPRPMTGFFANLTDEQKRKALDYRGEELHGSEDFAHRG